MRDELPTFEEASEDHGTLPGVTAPDLRAPRYIAKEPRGSKLVSPIRPSWWTRFTASLLALAGRRRGAR